MDLKRGLEKAVKVIVENLKSQTENMGEDFGKIQQVAAISANNDEPKYEEPADA
jgi:chaperonin GroEL